MAAPKTKAKAATNPRKRDAEATRDAILKSARRAFARHGYDGAGLREIAADAGVTAMLIGRYFGSKEQLFDAAIDDAKAGPSVINTSMPPAAQLGAYLAAGVLATTDPNATPLDGSLMMIRSAGAEPRIVEIGRRQVEKRHHKMLTAALKGDNAAERAALILSLIAGVQFMRQMLGLSALAKTPPATLQKLLAPVIQQLVDGKPG